MVSVERSFSTLKRMKTYLRNKNGEKRLTALALMVVHKDIRVDKEKVASQFSESARRTKLFFKIKSKGIPVNRKHFYGVPYISIFII